MYRSRLKDRSRAINEDADGKEVGGGKSGGAVLNWPWREHSVREDERDGGGGLGELFHQL
jgi:hypothetical protein